MQCQAPGSIERLVIVVEFRKNRWVHGIVKRIFFSTDIHVKGLKIIRLICDMNIKVSCESSVTSRNPDRYVPHLQAVSNVALIGAREQREVQNIARDIIHQRVVEDLIGPAPLIKART